MYVLPRPRSPDGGHMRVHACQQFYENHIMAGPQAANQRRRTPAVFSEVVCRLKGEGRPRVRGGEFYWNDAHWQLPKVLRTENGC